MDGGTGNILVRDKRYEVAQGFNREGVTARACAEPLVHMRGESKEMPENIICFKP